MTLQTARETLLHIFPGNPGMQKGDILYELAQNARDGCIVEVGAFTGFGTVALALGTADGKRLPVYAVDPFDERRGWTNEPYTSENLTTWTRAIDIAGVTDNVTLIRRTAAEAVEAWLRPVSLLFWDPGVKIDTVLAEFFAWADQVMVGGLLAVNDTLVGNLGVDSAVGELIETRCFELEGIRYGIRLVRRVRE